MPFAPDAETQVKTYLAHALHCSTPEAVDLRAALEQESLATTAAIKEIEFALTPLPAEERADYVSRLAELHDELQRLNARSTIRRQLLEVLRERRLLLDCPIPEIPRR